MEDLLPGLSSASNLHPMVVHFPIAFWVAATGAWWLGLLRKNDCAWRFGLWLQLLAVVGAIVAVVFGFLATDAMGHDGPAHDRVHVHRDFMLVATAFAVVLSALAWWKREAGKAWRVGLSIGSLVLVTVMTLGADRGAELVYRYGVGVELDAVGEHDDHHDDGHDHGHEHGH